MAETFLEAYITCALWSSTVVPFGSCPQCGTEDRVLSRWNDGQEYVCEQCGTREPNYEPPADDNYSASDIAPETMARMVKDCEQFVLLADDLLAGNYSQAGHDFWLTRNRHGAGYWDGDWDKEIGEKLTEIAHGFGECALCVGDDGKLHI